MRRAVIAAGDRMGGPGWPDEQVGVDKNSDRSSSCWLNSLASSPASVVVRDEQPHRSGIDADAAQAARERSTASTTLNRHHFGQMGFVLPRGRAGIKQTFPGGGSSKGGDPWRWRPERTSGLRHSRQGAQTPPAPWSVSPQA